MYDPRIQRWAEVLVRYSVSVQPGQIVAIQGGVEAEPLLRALYREALKAGGVPVLLPLLPGTQHDVVELASDEQPWIIQPVERLFREQADVTSQIMADPNTRGPT